VDKFCYLGDMLSMDGDADAAVESRIQTGWNKFKQYHCLPIYVCKLVCCMKVRPGL